MPTIYVKLTHHSQQGYNSTGENYTNGGFNYGIKTDRVNIFRYNNVPVPKGSTINSATLWNIYSGKNQTGTAYTCTQNVYVDGVTAVTPWLDTSRNEWTQRTWSLFGSTSTFNWNQSGASRQLHGHDIKPHLDVVVNHNNWTLAGGSLAVLVAYTAVSDPDNIYFHTTNDGYSPTLEINYTPPASDGKNTVVNIQENCNFVRNVNSASAFNIEPYGFNSWFGAYVQPNYSVTASFGGALPAPPGGGNALRVESTTGRPMVHFGIPILEDGEWYNYSAYVFMPNTVPSDMALEMTALGDKLAGTSTTTKGAWTRVDIDFIASTHEALWGTLHANGTTWNSTAAFYVANVQLTKGRRVKPYIAGSLTMTGATYGWAGSNTNGFVRATPPTATVTTQYDKARRKYYAVNWSYSQADSHAQVNADVQVRKVK